MPTNTKKKVHARMDKTGESYQTALRQIRGTKPVDEEIPTNVEFEPVFLPRSCAPRLSIIVPEHESILWLEGDQVVSFTGSRYPTSVHMGLLGNWAPQIQPLLDYGATRLRLYVDQKVCPPEEKVGVLVGFIPNKKLFDGPDVWARLRAEDPGHAERVLGRNHFPRGFRFGPDDLCLYTSGPAAEITYALYEIDGRETLLGPPDRKPCNPTPGHYYASLIVPTDAKLGPHRIRWSMRETPESPVQYVAQEFFVVE